MKVVFLLFVFNLYVGRGWGVSNIGPIPGRGRGNHVIVLIVFNCGGTGRSRVTLSEVEKLIMILFRIFFFHFIVV